MIKGKQKLTKEKQLELYLKEIAPRLSSGMKQCEIAEELDLSRQQIERAIKSSSTITDELVRQGIDPNQLHSGWVKVDGMSLYFQNDTNDTQNYEETLKSLKKHAPKYPKIKRSKVKDGHLLIIDPADIHIGKLSSAVETGQEYNSKIAIKRVKEGVEDILSKVSGINIDRIMLVIGNDVLHTDTVTRTTTRGTHQDTDGMWHEAFKLARKMYVDLIERLITEADVDVVYNISNHDTILGFTLADALYCWFSKNKNVTFDITPNDRKYYQYGKSMIMTSHGSGAKEKDIPHLAATEQPQMWADTDRRYAYLHHVHHYKKIWVRGGEDSAGFTIEYMRSPSSSDSWHHVNGFKSPMAVEGFVHSKDMGQILKLTSYF